MPIADRRLGGKNGIGRYALEVSAPTDFRLELAASFANQGSQPRALALWPGEPVYLDSTNRTNRTGQDINA